MRGVCVSWHWLGSGAEATLRVPAGAAAGALAALLGAGYTAGWPLLRGPGDQRGPGRRLRSMRIVELGLRRGLRAAPHGSDFARVRLGYAAAFPVPRLWLQRREGRTRPATAAPTLPRADPTNQARARCSPLNWIPAAERDEDVGGGPDPGRVGQRRLSWAPPAFRGGIRKSPRDTCRSQRQASLRVFKRFSSRKQDRRDKGSYGLLE